MGTGNFLNIGKMTHWSSCTEFHIGGVERDLMRSNTCFTLEALTSHKIAKMAIQKKVEDIQPAVFHSSASVSKD
jgi:hypothetical protein